MSNTGILKGDWDRSFLLFLDYGLEQLIARLKDFGIPYIIFRSLVRPNIRKKYVVQ